MNQYVRLGSEAQQKEYDIIGLQKFLLEKAIPESIEAYRFVSFKELCYLIKGTIKGKFYTYPNFLSTTLLKDYYSMEDIKQNKFTVTIRIPKGTSGRYIAEVNPNNPEYEILIPYRVKLKRISLKVYEIVIID